MHFLNGSIQATTSRISLLHDFDRAQFDRVAIPTRVEILLLLTFKNFYTSWVRTQDTHNNRGIVNALDHGFLNIFAQFINSFF